MRREHHQKDLNVYLKNAKVANQQKHKSNYTRINQALGWKKGLQTILNYSCSAHSRPQMIFREKSFGKGEFWK